jgi:hypothetical protein
MARIQYMDDGDYGGYRGDETAGDYTQPAPSYESYQAPAYQAPAQPTFTQPNYDWTGGFTGRGTDPRSGAFSQAQPFDYNAFRQSAEQISGGYSGSLDDFVNHIFPQLSQQFQGLERFGSKGDKIRLPNGEVIDAVISAGLGGRGYNWNPESPTSGAGYIGDPLMGQYIDRMNGLIDRLSGPQSINPTLQDAITKLQGMFANPGYTDAQRALLRTQVQEPLESQRAAGQQRALARASDRGLGLSSGVLEDEAQGIDMGFDRMIGEALRALATNEIGVQNQQRMSSAGQLAGIGQGLQGQELQAIAQALGATEQLGQLPLALQQMQIQAMNALNNQRVPQEDSMAGLIGILSSLAGQGENVYNTNMGQSGNLWASLFSQLPAILGAFSGGGASMSGIPMGDPHA